MKLDRKCKKWERLKKKKKKVGKIIEWSMKGILVLVYFGLKGWICKWKKTIVIKACDGIQMWMK